MKARAVLILGLTLDLFAALLAAGAQQSTKVRRIGLFIPGQPPACGSDQSPPVLTALREGFRDLGYVESSAHAVRVGLGLSSLGGRASDNGLYVTHDLWPGHPNGSSMWCSAATC